MPLFDYRCTKCHQIFENFAPAERSEDQTHHCGEPAVRLLSAFNVVGGYKAHDFKELRHSLGRKFNSTREVDDYCKSKGLERCDDIRPRKLVTTDPHLRDKVAEKLD